MWAKLIRSKVVHGQETHQSFLEVGKDQNKETEKIDTIHFNAALSIQRVSL